MKKLANLIALFVLVSVNVFTPITYAQTADPDDGDDEQGYDCEFISNSGDRSEGDGYYHCAPSSEGDYSCFDGDGYSYCETEGQGLNKCYPTYGDDEAPVFDCYVGYEMIYTENGYSFKESWSGEYSCNWDGGGESLGEDRTVNNRYGDYRCYSEGEGQEEFLGCDEDEEGGYICPFKYDCYKDGGAYSCDENPYGYYYCDSGPLLSLSRGRCWSDYYEDEINNCSIGDDNPGYNCPIVYSCSKGVQGVVCSEPESYNYNSDDYFYCESYGGGKKLSLESMGDSSCYQPEGNVYYEACDYDSNSKNYICEVPTTYSCTFDGKDGYECTEDDEGVYQCVYPDSLIESSVYDNVVCYYGDIYHGDCSPIDDGYFCPVKWGTRINDNGDYECLEYNGPSGNGGGVVQNNGRYVAEYNEQLGQCIYRVPGYDGEEIIIMSSNLGVTGGNLTGLYYQWGTGYGFPGYNGDTGGEESIEYQLSNEDMAIFDDYPTAEFSVWPTETDPCPEHFHVPSTTEWNNLLISWCENTEECDAAELTRYDSLVNHWALNDVSAENNYQGNYRFEDEVYLFMSDLNFLRGGSLDGYHANMLGLMGDYWAKEFKKIDKNGIKSSWGFTVYPRGGLGPVSFISNHAASVRCFADVEDDVEVSTPVALDLYIGGCSQGDSIAPTSAIEVLEDSVLCNNDGYLGRKFVAAGEEVDLDGLLPSGYQSWYLDDNKENKLEVDTFAEDTRLYAFKEIDPITLTVTKVRNDANNQDGVRPESVTVYLYSQRSLLMDTSKNLVRTVILSGGNNWRTTVSEPDYANTSYFWEEKAVSGYESTQTTSSQDSSWFITTLTNTHTPAVVTKYTVTFNSNGGSTINPVEVVEGQPVTKPTDPKRNGYSFGGWYTDPELTNEYKFTEPVIGPLTLHAKWTENKPSGGNSGGYSGGGGGHSKGGGGNTSDVESVEHGVDTPAKEENKSEPKPVVPGKGVNNTDKANPNQELFDAYEWAYANGLTKYGNMSDARMNDLLNRQEMAKITTIFASKFKNNTPNEAKRDFCSQYPDLWKTTEDMQEYIIQSCELGYMGYRANGIDALDRFRPYTPVSVAEVSIILSRIMWQNKYAINENLWYQGHLHAVYENNLLDNITKPFDYIARKDAYIMLYRISKTL